MNFKVHKIMPDASFFIPLPLSMNWIMAVNMILYGTMPCGISFAGYIRRECNGISVGLSSCAHEKKYFSKGVEKVCRFFGCVEFLCKHTHTHTHTHNRHARQYTEYYLNFNQLAGLFLSDYPAFPHKSHTINTIPPPLPSRQRREGCALPGGMRYMDMPCPYAAGTVYMPTPCRIQS